MKKKVAYRAIRIFMATAFVLLTGLSLGFAEAQKADSLSTKTPTPADTLKANTKTADTVTKAPVPTADTTSASDTLGATAKPVADTAKSTPLKKVALPSDTVADSASAPVPAPKNADIKTDSASTATVKKEDSTSAATVNKADSSTTASTQAPVTPAEEEEEDEDTVPFVRPFKPLGLYFFAGPSFPLGDWADDKNLGYNIGAIGLYRLNTFLGVGGGLALDNWRLEKRSNPVLGIMSLNGIGQLSTSSKKYFSYFIQAGFGLYKSVETRSDYDKSDAEYDLGYVVNVGLNMSRLTFMPGYKYVETWNDETLHWFTISLGINVNAPPDF